VEFITSESFETESRENELKEQVRAEEGKAERIYSGREEQMAGMAKSSSFGADGSVKELPNVKDKRFEAPVVTFP